MIVNKSAWEEISTVIDGNQKWEQQRIELLEKLIVSVVNEDYEEVFYLLKNGASINGILEERLTPLAVAIYNDDIDMVKALFYKGANINLIFDEGLDALHLATKLNYNEISSFLLENGANVKKYRMINTFETRLITAAKASNAFVVRKVLSLDKDSVNYYDSIGKTALHYNLSKSPYSQYDAEIAELLIAANADTNAVDVDGFKPIDYVEDSAILRSVLDKAILMNISNKGQKALNARYEKERLKEKEFIEKDIKEVFQPKMPSPKTMGKLKKFTIPKVM